MSKKNIILGSMLVVGLGISIYMWTAVGVGADTGDKSVGAKMQKFTCAKCKNTFEMTVAEAGAMRRSHDGQIICPACGADGAQKHDTVVSLGGGSGGFKPTDGEEKPSEEQPAEQPVKRKLGGAGRVKKGT